MRKNRKDAKPRKSLKTQAPLPPSLWSASQCLSPGAPDHVLLLCVFLDRETLKEEEELERLQRFHPGNFGPRKYCLRECMCEVEGQVPCPGLVPLPKEMTGKYKAALKAST